MYPAPIYIYFSTTNGVKVTVLTQYQPHATPPTKDTPFLFGYKIMIQNNTPNTIQLLRRHWYIYDIDSTPKEVEGEGVVGKQPILEAGETHEYVSGCSLTAGMGKMHGFYTMERQIDGKLFEVKVPEFTMIAPFLSN